MSTVREELIVHFGADQREIDRALKSLPQKAREWGGKMMGSLASALAAPIAFTGLVMAFDKAAALVDRLKRTAEGLKVNPSFLQDVQALARTSGSTDEKALKGIEKLGILLEHAQTEGGEAAETFEKFGISLTNTNGSARNVEEAMRAIMDKIAGTEDGLKRAAIAAAFFGEKVGVELVAALSAGSAGLDKMAESASKLSEEDIAVIDDMKDSIDELGRSALLAGARIFAGIKQGIDKVKGADLAKAGGFAAISPLVAAGKAFNAVLDAGADNSGPGPELLPGGILPDTAADKKGRVKLLAEQFAIQKKAYDERMQAEARLGQVEESNAQKVARLTKETNALQSDINADKFEGVENDRQLTILAQKRLELKKAEAEAEKDSLKDAKKKKDSIDRAKKAQDDLNKSIAERNGFTIGQLAGGAGGDGDFDPAAGVRGHRARRNARRAYDNWARLSPEEAQIADMANEAQSARDYANFALQHNKVFEAQAANDYADQITNQLNSAFPGVLKPSELAGSPTKLLEELVKMASGRGLGVYLVEGLKNEE